MPQLQDPFPQNQLSCSFEVILISFEILNHFWGKGSLGNFNYTQIFKENNETSGLNNGRSIKTSVVNMSTPP